MIANCTVYENTAPVSGGGFENHLGAAHWPIASFKAQCEAEPLLRRLRPGEPSTTPVGFDAAGGPGQRQRGRAEARTARGQRRPGDGATLLPGSVAINATPVADCGRWGRCTVDHPSAQCDASAGACVRRRSVSELRWCHRSVLDSDSDVPVRWA